MTNHKQWIISLSAALILFSGCGNEEKENATSVKPQIKVTQNAVNMETKTKESQSNSGKFYYSYNKEKKDYKSQPPKTKTTIDAYLNIKSPYERVRITMMIKRLSNDYIIKCSACHNDYANGVIGPSLLDKNADFIYQRLQDYKNDKKKNVLMKELVEQIDNQKLKSLAEEIANFNKEIIKMRRNK